MRRNYRVATNPYDDVQRHQELADKENFGQALFWLIAVMAMAPNLILLIVQRETPTALYANLLSLGITLVALALVFFGSRTARTLWGLSVLFSAIGSVTVFILLLVGDRNIPLYRLLVPTANMKMLLLIIVGGKAVLDGLVTYILLLSNSFKLFVER